MSNYEQAPVIGVRTRDIDDGLLRDVAAIYFSAAYEEEPPDETEIYDICDDEYWGDRTYGSLLSEDSKLLVLREPGIKVVHFDLAVNIPDEQSYDVEHTDLPKIPSHMRERFVRDVSQYLTETGLAYRIMNCVHFASGPGAES